MVEKRNAQYYDRNEEMFPATKYIEMVLISSSFELIAVISSRLTIDKGKTEGKRGKYEGSWAALEKKSNLRGRGSRSDHTLILDLSGDALKESENIVRLTISEKFHEWNI